MTTIPEAAPKIMESLAAEVDALIARRLAEHDEVVRQIVREQIDRAVLAGITATLQNATKTPRNVPGVE